MNTTHMGLRFSRLFQSWEVEAFYHASSSRLFLPPPLLPTHPQRPDDSPSQFPSSQGRLDMGPSAGCQCQRVSQTVSLPAQRAGLHSAAAHQPSLRQGKDYLPACCVCFFLFLWKKAGLPSFPFCHLLWVESSLTGVGNSNNKKQAPSFNVSYLSRWWGQQKGFQECAKDPDSS